MVNIKYLTFRKGQTTVEIMVALLILATALAGAVTVIFGGQSLGVDSEMSNIALRLARENLEKNIANYKTNFTTITSSTVTEGDFTKVILVENLDASHKKVTSRVFWQTDPSRQQEQAVSTIVTNWYDVSQTGGDTGGGGTSGDWKNPRTLGTVDLGPGVSATGLDVLHKIVYMSGDASDPKKNDFFIVDATDGQNPFIVSSLNTGPGASAVDVAGSFAYLANKDTGGQLQVVSVSNISSPVLESSFKLPGVSGTGAMGKSLFYRGGKVYIGTKKAIGPEFHVVDVSNPASPAELGSYKLDADINSIVVSGDLAYLATSDDSKELVVLDISNPAAISQKGSFDASGTDDGMSVYIYGNFLYLGRSAGVNDLVIVNIADPSNPIQVSSNNLGGVSVNGMRVRDGLAFVGTSDSNQEFQVWNVSDPNNISLWSYFNFPQIAQSIDYEDNYVYAAVRSNDALRIITSQ